MGDNEEEWWGKKNINKFSWRKESSSFPMLSGIASVGMNEIRIKNKTK